MDIRRIHQLSEDMYKNHAFMLPLWQNIAMECWPEMADFNTQRNMGQELADHLMSGLPSMCRRELGDAFESMTRTDDWFSMKTGDPERDLDNDARVWTERSNKRMRRIMYDRKAGFMRACKQVDHGYAAVGQWPMTIELNQNRTGMLYRAWHLRDVAFQEDISGQVCTISHKIDNLSARDVCKMFPGKCSQRIETLERDKPFEKVKIVRVILPTEMTEGDGIRQPYVSIYYDPESQTELEVTGQWDPVYLIPRWNFSGSISQYAHSPASIIANPDSRMFQQMTLAMLDAAEKGANPPMVARADLFREDAPFSANSVGWADIEADEDIRKQMMVLPGDKSGMAFSMDMWNSTKGQIARAWYNDMLQPPDTSRARTAYEASIIVQNHIRGLMPVFQPVTPEYQAPLCERTFNHLMRQGAFGPIQDIPESLQGTDIEFEFVSPITQAQDQKKVAQFHQALDIITLAAGVDPDARYILDVKTSARDALQGGEVQAKWLFSPQVSADMVAQAAQQAQTQQMLDQVQQGSEIAKNLTGADGAGIVPENSRQPAPAFGA